MVYRDGYDTRPDKIPILGCFNDNRNIFGLGFCYGDRY